MKLLIVSREHSGDRIFGLGKTVSCIADGLKALGHSVRYITVSDWSEEDHTQFKKTIVQGSFIARMFGFKEYLMPALAERFVQGKIAYKIAHAEEYTHVWLQDPWIALGYLFAKLLNIRPSKKVFFGVSEHGYGSFTQAVIADGLLLDEKWTCLLLKLEHYVLKKASFVWSPSHAALAMLTKEMHYPVTPRHWHVMGYGKPHMNVISKHEARHALGWNETYSYVIAVGRVAPVKRYELIIEACAKAECLSQKPLQLVIVGATHDDALVHFAQHCGLHNPPLFYLDTSVESYLSAADIYMSGCEQESFGMANMEAICANLPSIIAAGGGSLEVVSYGGWLCHVNVDSFTYALSSLLNDTTLRTFWSNNAKERSKDYLEWKDIVIEYEKTLLGLV